MNINQRHPLVESAYLNWQTSPTPDKPEWAKRIRDVAPADISSVEVNSLADSLRMLVGRENRKGTPSRAERLAESHPFLAEQSDKVGFPVEQSPYFWAKTPEGSFFVRVKQEGGEAERTIAEAIKDIISDSGIRPYEPIEVKPEREELINGILSDMHVGLNPNPNRRAMYPVEYGPGIFRDNMNKFYGSLKGNVDQLGPVSMMGILDLGDGMDGMHKLTTRGGHELEQNLDNIDQFQTFVGEKLRLAENLIHSGMAKRYIFNNVSNDNHAGDFAAIANMTIQMILERSYPKEVVMFRVMHKPLEHFIYGDHAYIVMHGKDQQYQFKGLPLILNPQTEKYIRAYIDYHKITSRFIHVLKGDLHQNAYSRCQLFDYRSLCSFAPPSQWVSSNFPGSYSGYAIQRVPKWSGEVQHTDYLLEFDRVAEPVPAHEYVY